MDDWIITIVTNLGHWGVACLMFLENVIPPIPSELIMPLAGFAAARGELSFFGVVFAGTAGAVAGQFPLYYLGRVLGEERIQHFVDRYGKWVAVSGSDVTRATDWFRRHRAAAVLICRLVPGIRSLISIPAGVARINLGIFTVYSFLGICLWTTFLAGLGYTLGEDYHRIEHLVGFLSRSVLILLGVSLLIWLGWRVLKRNRKKSQDDRA